MSRKPLAATTVEIGGVMLTAAERKLLHVIASGDDSNKAAARKLNLSPYTVNDQLDTIYRKLGVRSRVAAAVWAVRNGVA